MAEAVAVLSMANAGFKLAITLFSFAEAIGSIDKEIVRTAKDISLFSDVLNNLVATLERGKDAKYITKSLFETIQKVIDECKELFQELEMMIEKSTTSEEVIKMKEDEVIPLIGSKLSVPLTKRLLYFFQRSKLEALRNLESLKTTLNLMLGVLAIAEKYEKTDKSPNARADSETAKALRTQDSLKMKCLLLANEAATAEVRKHAKTKIQNAKEKFKKNEIVLEARPSIASEGVVRELKKQPPASNSEASASRPSDKAPSNERSLAPVWLPTDLPAGMAGRDPEEPKISIQETSQVIVSLVALWVSNGAQSVGNDDRSKAAAGVEDRGKYEGKGRADKVGELPERQSRRYSGTKDHKLAKQEAEDESIDLFPRRALRPY